VMFAETRPGAAAQLLGAHRRDIDEKEAVGDERRRDLRQGRRFCNGGLLVGRRLEFVSHKLLIVPRELARDKEDSRDGGGARPA